MRRKGEWEWEWERKREGFEMQDLEIKFEVDLFIRSCRKTSSRMVIRAD